MFIARDPEWSGPEIDIDTMATLGARINAKKKLKISHQASRFML